MLGLRLENLKKTKVRDDLDNEQLRLVGEDILSLVKNLSVPSLTCSQSQYDCDCSRAKALEEVCEILNKRGICI